MFRPDLVIGLIFICVFGTNLAMAQPNVRPEPNMLLPPQANWPIEVKTPDATVEKNAVPGPPILHFCMVGTTKWPEKLQQACANYLLEEVSIGQARQKALYEFQSTLGKEHALFRVKHAQLTLENQTRQGNILFWIVVLTVCVGILSALAQFLRSFYVKDEQGSAEIAVSNNEFKFRTTWLGALLLGMSGGFLVLYLYFVYPVRLVGS